MRLGLARRNDTNGAFGLIGRDIDRFFDEFFSLEPVRVFSGEWVPRVDVSEDENAIHVKAEVPGISEKDLNVTIEHGVLTIAGEKKEERKEEDDKKRVIVSERSYGSFCRTITLPEAIKADEIRASFKDGILTIEVPKAEEVKPRKIPVSVN
ncbi:MAG: Hsp20/alpha crystallin family protein [Spirochaetes bacterium]|nr:Hsp20/alpha crystallin family protein [Spirochaetota bacterium]